VRAFAILLFTFAIMVMGGCGNPITFSESNQGAPRDSLVNYYRTHHFVFFYDTSVYSHAEITSNGATKEAHLARIDKELGVSFDKEIMVRLISNSGQNWSGQAYPREPYFIQETRDYFTQDNGHEIVHIVSGFPAQRFFVEGLAAAHELAPLPKWTRLCSVLGDSSQVLEVLTAMTDVGVSDQVDYTLAAAYVEWLEDTFGLERFKRFYRDLSEFRNSGVSSLYFRNFGAAEEDIHKRFISERFNMAMGSRYCAH
jgi:PKD repeat protein